MIGQFIIEHMGSGWTCWRRPIWCDSSSEPDHVAYRNFPPLIWYPYMYWLYAKTVVIWQSMCSSPIIIDQWGDLKLSVWMRGKNKILLGRHTHNMQIHHSTEVSEVYAHKWPRLPIFSVAKQKLIFLYVEFSGGSHLWKASF